MKCQDFENYLFENPDAKQFPREFSDHLLECEKCLSIWKVQECLVNIERDKIRFSISPAIRAKLILYSRKEFLLKGSSSLIEDSLVISLLVSLFIFGVVASAPNLMKFQFFERVMPHFRIFTEILEPFVNKVQIIFSNQQGYFWVSVVLFFITFAFTVFIKTLNPKKGVAYF